MWHEQHLQQSMMPGTIAFDQHRQALVGFLGKSVGAANANHMALAQIYQQLTQQAQTQGYQDVYMELSWASIILIALAFMLSKNRPGGGDGGGGGMH
jgi:DHA2 family multidrug resistance protein